MRPQKMVTLDVEGVLIPEVWVNLAIRTGIDDLKRTTRDEPNYDKLMNERLEILDREGVTMGDLRAVLAEMGPLEGAHEFLQGLRDHYQVILLSDTFQQFASPLMKQLDALHRQWKAGAIGEIDTSRDPALPEPPRRR